ncbi:MAG: hypothetical protein AB7H97_18150, partial [Pseudobdellovibrionaceae bacterium]
PASDQCESRLLASAFSGIVKPWFLPFLSGAISMLFSFFIFLLAQRWSRCSDTAKERLRLALPIFAVALFALVKSLSLFPRISTLVLVFALSFGFYIWFIALSLDRSMPGSLYSSKKNFWIFSLFFWRDTLPYWHLDSLTAINSNPDKIGRIPYDRLFWKICELAAVAAIFWVGDQILFVHFGLPHPWYIGTAEFIALSPNVYTAWVTLVFLTMRFLVFVYVRGSIGALTLFLFGVTPVFNMNKPWKSKSLHEFVGRSIYFYNLTLTTVYWPMSLRLLRKTRWNHRLKLFVLVFASAFYFSFFYHLIRGHQMLLKNTFAAGLVEYSVSIMPYVLLFSLSMGLSVALKEIWQWGNHWLILRVFKVCLFIIIYSLILSLDFNYQFEAVPVRLSLIKFLFTGLR